MPHSAPAAHPSHPSNKRRWSRPASSGALRPIDPSSCLPAPMLACCVDTAPRHGTGRVNHRPVTIPPFTPAAASAPARPPAGGSLPAGRHLRLPHPVRQGGACAQVGAGGAGAARRPRAVGAEGGGRAHGAALGHLGRRHSQVAWSSTHGIYL